MISGLDIKPFKVQQGNKLTFKAIGSVGQKLLVSLQDRNFT